MNVKRFAIACLSLFALCAQPVSAADKANTVYMDLKGGRVTIELRPDLAPKHVERFKKLTKEGFYNGLKWHRVITAFMAQTGDPTGTGESGSKYPDLKAEFNSAPFKRGALGAARTGNPDSANSQFFICFEDSPHLNGKYTMFGQVVDGMQIVDRLKKGDGPNGTVFNPDTVIKMQLATDAK